MRDYNRLIRMSNVAAALGVAQLKKIRKLNNSRIKNARYLSGKLKGIAWLITPYRPEEARGVFHQYTIRIKQGRDKFIEYLKTKGIAAAPNYSLPIHKQPAYKKLGYGKYRLPEAERAAREIVNIPVHPALKRKDLEELINAVKSWKK